ncbi:tetratricopeptide repeat protein [uncultured Fluviicola sp.]|uniref:tetratricopeptide repeat protein n=1 Tax=uncultured Fluviicola sp. TaxID=463303 RepID=UPI0025D7C40D|nr:tetratricopeptide repeat protein [uncultured Fluviicola sp.]
MKSAVELLPVGTYFYFRKDSLYYLFQLLEVSPNQILAQTFWSTTNVPSMDKFYQFDVKSACSEFDEQFDELVEIGKEEITAEQQKEIIQFRKIKASKVAREAGFLTLKREALEAFEKGEYREAVRLFSLAAPYSKYDIELYEKRGLSYLKLGQYADALADFDYYLIHDPENEIVRIAMNEAISKKK